MSPSLSFSLAPRPHRNPRTCNAPTARTQTCGAHIHPPHVRAHTTCASVCPRRTCHRTRSACMCFVPRRATASWASALPTALIAHLAIALAAKRGGARMSCEASAWPTRHQCDCAASACCHFSGCDCASSRLRPTARASAVPFPQISWSSSTTSGTARAAWDLRAGTARRWTACSGALLQVGCLSAAATLARPSRPLALVGLFVAGQAEAHREYSLTPSQVRL